MFALYVGLVVGCVFTGLTVVVERAGPWAGVLYLVAASLLAAYADWKNPTWSES